KLLEEHIAERARVDAVELLRLAADEPDGKTDSDWADVPVDIDVLTDELTATDEAAPIGADAHDWVAALLAGLPDVRLEEAPEPPGFHGELRHYQRRGLAWMQFLTSVGLGGCLADDMGLGKTATTLAHLVQ